MRKAKPKPRMIQEDQLYKHRLVTKLVNRSMKDGKKAVAQRQVYEAFAKVKKGQDQDALKVFLQAIENIKPDMEVRPRRIGGAAYMVPAPVRGPRKESLAIRWLILAANARPNKEYKTYASKLAQEIIDAAKGGGGAVVKKQTMERQAEANRAFAHFRW